MTTKNNKSSSGLRQRKKKQKEANASPPTIETRPAQQHQEVEPTLWQVFHSHPLGYCLTRVLPFLAIPYSFYVGYLFIVLQHPEWISAVTLNTVNLRPAVSLTDARQVLIVGTMSSGTVQVAQELSTKLGLEVGHEDADASWSFVRDGTVSWFHGIRFFPPIPDNTARLRVYRHLCLEQYSPNMVFHPRMYHQPRNNCSKYVKWDKCWARECMDIVGKEWGCAALTNSSCETPFPYTLHQVRNPLRTIESLVAKFCVGGLEGAVQAPFLQLLQALFDNTDGEDLSCIEAAAGYVLNYTNALLAARRQEGSIIQGMYKIEETTPCQVAQLAGLMNATTTLYPPNYEKVKEKCDPDTPHAAQQLMEDSSHQINVNLVKLTWSDLEGGKHGSQRPEGDKEMEQAIKDLFVKLGYDVEKEQDASDPVFDF